MAQGILTAFLQELAKLGLHAKPVATQNELVFEVSQQEFENAVLKGVDPRARGAIKVELHEGKIVIRVRLF